MVAMEIMRSGWRGYARILETTGLAEVRGEAKRAIQRFPGLLAGPGS